MPKDAGRVRLIAVYRIVNRGGSVTVSGIRKELLDRYGIAADRRSIYDDLVVIDRFTPIRVVGGGRNWRYERYDPAKE